MRCLDRHFIGAGGGIRTGKFPFRYYGNAVSSVYHYHCRVGNHLYGGGTDTEPGNVFAHSETGGARQEETHRVP